MSLAAPSTSNAKLLKLADADSRPVRVADFYFARKLPAYFLDLMRCNAFFVFSSVQ